MRNSSHVKKDGITLIAANIKPDFDAVASMVAAQKLYPDALVVFPDSQENNLRDFFLNSMMYLLNSVDIKEIDFDRVTRLILVGTRQPRRIGKLAQLLERTGLDIHIYDHHPPAPGDIKGSLEMVEPLGATVTILAEIIIERMVKIGPG